MENIEPLVLPDGTKIYTLMDLYFWLKNADDDIIKILLNGKENKLAKWALSYFNNLELHNDLLLAKTKEDVFNIIKKYVFEKRNIDKFDKLSKAEAIYMLVDLK